MYEMVTLRLFFKKKKNKNTWYDMGVQKDFNWLSEVSEESHGKEMVLSCILKDEWKLVKLIWKKGKYNRKKISVAGEFIYTYWVQIK